MYSSECRVPKKSKETGSIQTALGTQAGNLNFFPCGPSLPGKSLTEHTSPDRLEMKLSGRIGLGFPGGP